MTRRLALLALLALAGALGPAAGAGAAAPLLTIGVEPTAGTLAQATYELQVTNHGDAPAEDVRVSATVPANTTFGSADPAPSTACAAAGSACVWQLGVVPAGVSRTITVVYALTEAATYTVAAAASVTEGDEPAHDSDTDSSLTRGTFVASDDTWVDDGEAAGTNHGACDELKISGGAVSAYLEADEARFAAFGMSTEVAVYVAELSARVKTPAPGVAVALHPLRTAGWVRGRRVLRRSRRDRDAAACRDRADRRRRGDRHRDAAGG